ncbi:MAG TPA: PfkB family carbohydrate kinase [Vicinamibacterales bacterium]|nr:PfkB family carbohydrate kinase [Vicinamibacterales bacterium]
MDLPLSLLRPDARPFDVVGLGQNSHDIVAYASPFPAPNTKARLAALRHMPGGQVASAIVCCARLGWRTRYIGTFGGDEAGTAGRDSLVAEGVDVSAALTRVEARTRTAIVIVDERSGERTVLWDRDPRLVLDASDVPLEAATSGRVLLVDAEDLPASTATASAARASGIVTVVDVDAVEPGVDRLLAAIDVLIVSEGFPEAMTGASSTGEGLARLDAAFHPSVACVTLGPNGCLARCRGREIHVPAFPVSVVDSTGAGDAFRGGFISALLAGHGSLEDLLAYANAVAALNCRGAGARAALPRPDEVDALLNAHRR